MDTLTQLLAQVAGPGELGPAGLELLEAFLGEALVGAGAWRWLESDGVAWATCRAAEAHRVRLCGRVWHVGDQRLHAFWLDVMRSGDAAEAWTLHYDVDEARLSPRAARSALELVAEPGEVAWRITLSDSGSPGAYPAAAEPEPPGPRATCPGPGRR